MSSHGQMARTSLPNTSYITTVAYSDLLRSSCLARLQYILMGFPFAEIHITHLTLTAA